LPSELSVIIGGMEIKNPLVVASGLPSTFLLKKFIDAGVGAVTTKTVTPMPRRGHPPPTIVDVGIGYINAVGLKNPGIAGFKEEVAELVEYGEKRNARIIGSAGGKDIDGYLLTSSKLEEYGVHMVELNVSCPTVKEVYSTGTDLKHLKEVVREVRSVINVPLAVKLSPDIREIGRASKIAVDAGADVLVIANTISPATAIDIWSGKPKLGNPEGFGGLSGRALKPVALAKVMQAYAEVGVDIIAMGGVMTWEDIVEMILAGGKAVGFLTAYFRYKNTSFIGEWLNGLNNYMGMKGYKSIEDFRGLTLEHVKL
jgi:dihydroorotate dehydrogenase (NAD+) catalytic subunit